MVMVTIMRHIAETRTRRDGSDAAPHETDDDVLNRQRALVPEGDDEGLYTPSFRAGLLDARLDIREGHLVDHGRVQRRLGSRRRR